MYKRKSVVNHQNPSVDNKLVREQGYEENFALRLIYLFRTESWGNRDTEWEIESTNDLCNNEDLLMTENSVWHFHMILKLYGAKEFFLFFE